MKALISKHELKKLDSQSQIALKELAINQPSSIRRKSIRNSDLPLFLPEGRKFLLKAGKQLSLF